MAPAPTESADRRIGLILDYFPAHGRQSAGHGSATLVRGRDDHGHFAPEPAPVGEFTERNIQARRKVLYAYPNNVYFGVTPDGGAAELPRPARCMNSGCAEVTPSRTPPCRARRELR